MITLVVKSAAEKVLTGTLLGLGFKGSALLIEKVPPAIQQWNAARGERWEHEGNPLTRASLFIQEQALEQEARLRARAEARVLASEQEAKEQATTIVQTSVTELRAQGLQI